MFISLVTAIAVAIFIRNQGIGFKRADENSRVSKIYAECIDELEEELKRCDLENQGAVQELLENKYNFLVGYEFYVVNQEGEVIAGSHLEVQKMSQDKIVNGIRSYEVSESDSNIFKLSGCDELKEGYYLYYMYLKYDENDTSMLVAALIGALILFFLFIWGRISYISTIRTSVAEIAKGDLSYRVPYRYSNELRDLAEDINQMADALASEEQKKNEFLTNISHDIRTPLTTILGYLEMIKSEKYDSKEELNSYMEIMERKGKFLASMLEDFFQYSKLASNDIQLNEQPFELNELLRQFYEDEEMEFKEKQLILQLGLHHQPIKCTGDIELIARVVSNLLSNAIKYSKPNTVVNLKSEVEKIDHVIYGAFSVSSMPKEPISDQEVEMLFERLYKRDDARSEAGSGLGLSIVKNIIRLHGGKVKGYKEEEKLVFKVLLKL